MAIRRFSSTDSTKIWEHLNRIADDIDAELADTGWVQIPRDGATGVTGSQLYRIKAGVVYFSGVAIAAFSTTFKKIGKLPTAALPNDRFYGSAARYEVVQGAVTIAANGDVSFRSLTGTMDQFEMKSIPPYPAKI